MQVDAQSRSITPSLNDSFACPGALRPWERDRRYIGRSRRLVRIRRFFGMRIAVRVPSESEASQHFREFRLLNPAKRFNSPESDEAIRPGSRQRRRDFDQQPSWSFVSFERYLAKTGKRGGPSANLRGTDVSFEGNRLRAHTWGVAPSGRSRTRRSTVGRSGYFAGVVPDVLFAAPEVPVPDVPVPAAPLPVVPVLVPVPEDGVVPVPDGVTPVAPVPALPPLSDEIFMNSSRLSFPSRSVSSCWNII
jgi:hypothetical protein